MRAVIYCVLLASVAALAHASRASNTTPSGTYDVTEVSDKVTMSDGVVLGIDGYVPVPRDNTTLFPVLIFPNSWGMPIIEYILKTLNFAQDGYVSIEYETRGWYTSGGEIDCAGPKDAEDASAILTYVLARSDWQVDADQVAFVGISYGAGLALTAAGNDPRVKTAVCLSGWTNISKMMLNYETPNLVWGSLLEESAKLLGHPSAEMQQLYIDAMKHENLTFIRDFTAKRSPGRFLDVLNARGTPLFLSHNHLDRLFRSEYTLDFYTQLTTKHKFVMINQGVHAEPEAFGLFDIGNNKIWGNVRLWLDHYLLGRDTDITQMPPVQIQLGLTITDQTYLTFDNWPTAAITNQVFYMCPRGSSHFAPLTTTPPSAPPSSNSTETIGFTLLPALTAGVPILTALVRSIGIPFDTEILLAPESENMIYRSDALNGDTVYCGIPELSITVSSNKPSWQVYAYLYDVDALDIAYLMTETYYTHWGAASDAVNVPYTLTGLQFHTLCHTFPAGHKVALGVVLYSGLWEAANTDGDLTATFLYTNNATLTMPLNPQ
jgi:predicted acyl esterase